jgi:hypothetical protein
MKTKLAECGNVKIDPTTGLVRVDGIIVGRRVLKEDGKVALQFKDGDHIRSNCRGTMFVEICLDDFLYAVMENGIMT